MRLRADQIESHLERSGLASIYYLSGDEPLQMMETADQIRQSARNNGFEERSILNVAKGFDWNQLHQEGANMSLFASRRLIELRLGEQKPGKEGAAAFVEYANNLNPDNVLLITGGKIDKRTQQTKWHKALDEHGVTVQVWPIEPARLADWISQRMRKQGKKIQRDAALLIAQRVEGNLLAAKQEIEKLSLLFEKTDIDSVDVISSVSDSARFDVFALIESAYLGNIERTSRMLRGLRNEGVEAIGIFGALMWEFRRTCAIAYAIESGAAKEQVFRSFNIWQQRKAALNAILKRLNTGQLTRLLRDANTIDKTLKGAMRGDAWDQIESFLFRVAGIHLESPTI